jgi:hypothetical protein
VPAPELLGFDKVHKFLEPGEIELNLPAPPIGGYQWSDWFVVIVQTEIESSAGEWSPPGSPWATDLVGPMPRYTYRRWHEDDAPWVSSGHTDHDVSTAFIFAFRNGGMVHTHWPSRPFQFGGLGLPKRTFSRLEVPTPLAQDTMALGVGLAVSSLFDDFGRHINGDPAITGLDLYRASYITHTEDDDDNFLAFWTDAIPAGTTWDLDVPDELDAGIPQGLIAANWELLIHLTATGGGNGFWHFVEYALDPLPAPLANPWSVGFINTPSA